MTEKPQPLDLGKIKKEVLDEYCGGIPFDEIEEFQLEPEQIEKIIEITIYRIKQQIKSACKFYLRYKDKPELLVKEHPELKTLIEKLFDIEGKLRNDGTILRNILDKFGLSKITLSKSIYYDHKKYNEWLFKLTFKDVFEDENEKE